MAGSLAVDIAVAVIPVLLSIAAKSLTERAHAQLQLLICELQQRELDERAMRLQAEMAAKEQALQTRLPIEEENESSVSFKISSSSGLSQERM